jgi:hypothetical protein
LATIEAAMIEAAAIDRHSASPPTCVCVRRRRGVAFAAGGAIHACIF